MKKTLFVLTLSYLFISGYLAAQNTFVRKYQIPLPAVEPEAFGNVIAGVDFDGDGKKEIYAVNENWNDTPGELIPRIYKYEFNGTGYDSVWSAVLNIPKQNTWAPLTYGDIDGDGKMELIWGPVNFLDQTVNPNPARVVVFKSKGDGSDIMGVPDGNGNYKPNATYTITSLAMDEQRPFKFVCADVDNDGKDEIIYTSRKGYTLGVIGVDKIPANGDGSEKWTLKYKYSGTIGYDLVVMNKVIYQFTTDGTIIATKFDGTNWNSYKSASNLIPSGSWKSACVVDLDKDGKKEIVAGSAKAGASKVFLIQVDKDTVYTISEIADLNLGTTGVLRGGDCGDIDNDGKIDFVYGSKAASVNGTISRLSYKGGSITDKNSYEVSVLDKGLASGGEWDIVKIANVDNDPYPEVIYGNHTDGRTPLTILGLKIQAPETIAWEKTSAKKTLPAYFGSNTERGMAFGKFNENYRMFVVSRNGGPKVIMHNAFTGDSIATLINPKTNVGYFPLNCAGVSQDAKLYVCNMTLDAKAAAFTVYRWDTEADTGRAVISYTPSDASMRMGDMFTVSGQGNNTVIYAGIQNQNKVVKFTTTDMGKTFVPTVITLNNAVVKTNPNVSPAPDGSFYFKSYTQPIVHYKADGTPIDTISASLVSSSATKIQYFELNGKKFIATYVPFAGQTGLSENVQIFNITNPNKQFLADQSPSLGSVSNSNGTGSIEYFPYLNDAGKSSSVFFIMGSNNGIAAYTLNPENIPMPVAINWEKTAAKKSVPAYFGSNTERGMALGKVNGEYQLFVVSRNGGPKIIVHDAVTGDSLYVIKKPAVDVGYFPLNVAGVSEDGDLYAANMTLDASSAAFTVYRWNTTDTAKQVISFKAPAAGWRMGDAFNVYGKTSDNSLTIWCGVTSQGKLVKFTTSDYGKTFKENVITLDGTSFGSVPNIALLNDGSFYYKTYSKPIIHFSADGKVIDTIKVSNTSATNIKYFEMNNKKYLASYLPAAGQAGISENVQLIDITSSANPVLAAATPSLGKISNLNGTGGVEVMKYNKDNKETVVFYVMGSNNGIAAYTYDDNMMLAVIDTLFYGNSQNLLKNPFGAGFIAGTNSYHDLGKAERFDMLKDDEIVALKYYFAYKKIVGTPDTLNFVIRGNNNGKPGSILKALSITTDKIDTTGQGNVFFLDSPIKVAAAGAVFVGVEWSQTANDTIALFTDKNGEGDKKSRAWELYSDGTWGYFDQPTSSSWNLDADLWIGVYYKKGPQVTGVNDGNMKIPMEYLLAQNYPNPFNPMTTIKFSLRVAGKVSLKVYNILGMEVASLVDGDMQAGQQIVNFNASRFASGVYIYSLKVEGRDGSKFNSAKKMLLLK
ncbi:MAG: FG-GAP-like repeat-containing protein [Bacteroidota bacterium]|nr:FG-GAP-like repeat-containing protein [Bacteroidota bacterium]